LHHGCALDIAQRCPRPAQHRFYTGSELARRERLVDVVVGTQIDAQHAISLTPPGRQHHHHDWVARSQPPAHPAALDARRHDVEHDEVAQPGTSADERFPSVADDIHREALAFEVARDLLGARTVVLYDQDACRCIGHHDVFTIVATAIAVAACSPSHALAPRRRPTPSTAPAGKSQIANGSQIRSTSPLDIPLIIAAAKAISVPPARSHIQRSRRRAGATTTAGPSAIERQATSATRKSRYGRRPPTPT